MVVTFAPDMVTISFSFMDNLQEQEQLLQAAHGDSLLEVALRNNVPLMHQCGGICACSTCQVKIVKGMELISEAALRELKYLEKKSPGDAEARLACQCILTKESGYVEVQIPSIDNFINQ